MMLFSIYFVKNKKSLILTSVLLGLSVLIIGMITNPSKASAEVGCYPPGNAWYFNATVAVKIIEPDGRQRWSDDFQFKTTAFDPMPFGIGVDPINPNSGINWAGKPGFPTNSADFRATKGGEGTEQCPTLTPQSDPDATVYIFGDSTGNKPFLACLWGAGSQAPKDSNGNRIQHGLGFAFDVTKVFDTNGLSGHWVNGYHADLVPGGFLDSNNLVRNFVFTYQLDPPQSIPNFDFGIDSTTCDLVAGWAYYSPLGSNPVQISVYVDGGPGQGVPGWTFYADKESNDVLQLKGYPGNHRFAFSPRGDPRGVDFSISHTLNFYAANIPNSPLYASRTMPACPNSGFTITPVPYNPALNDNESPGFASFKSIFRSNVSRVTGVNITCKYSVKQKNLDLGTDDKINQTVTNNDSSTATCIKDNVALSNLQAGDQVCILATVNPANGTSDSSGNILNSNNSSSTVESCTPVVNKPYLTFYGSDVRAGGAFEGIAANCSTQPQSSILTLSNSSGRGSSVQFAAFALGTISPGFATASLRPVNDPLRPNGLKAPSFGDYTGCKRNYFADAPTTAAGLLSISPSTASGKYNILPGNFNGGTINTGQHIFVYVNGDVTITSPIQFSSNWGSVRSDIPSFYLIAKGNITIDPSVKRLDGVYVAQATSATTGGIINTCAAADRYNNCGNPLVINGSFTARKVLFNRTFGSLRDGSLDTTYPGVGTKNCTRIFPTQPTVVSCAAEQFIFNPGLYLADAPSANSTPGTPDSGYQYAASLPPVL